MSTNLASGLAMWHVRLDHHRKDNGVFKIWIEAANLRCHRRSHQGGGLSFSNHTLTHTISTIYNNVYNIYILKYIIYYLILHAGTCILLYLCTMRVVFPICLEYLWHLLWAVAVSIGTPQRFMQSEWKKDHSQMQQGWFQISDFPVGSLFGASTATNITKRYKKNYLPMQRVLYSLDCYEGQVREVKVQPP